MAKTKLSTLTPDRRNANRGTERGQAALESSLRKYGAGRSILVDRNGQIIAGNKTAETAAAIGIDDVIIVESDGTKLVAVKRTDLDLDSKAARELAYADNRVGQIDLDFDPAQMLADIEAGIDLSGLWFDNEVYALAADDQKTELKDAEDSYDGRLGDASKQIKAVLYAADIGDFERAIKATGQKQRAVAIMEVCRHYLETHEKGQLYAVIESATQA